MHTCTLPCLQAFLGLIGGLGLELGLGIGVLENPKPDPKTLLPCTRPHTSPPHCRGRIVSFCVLTTGAACSTCIGHCGWRSRHIARQCTYCRAVLSLPPTPFPLPPARQTVSPCFTHHLEAVWQPAQHSSLQGMIALVPKRHPHAPFGEAPTSTAQLTSA